MNKIKIIARHKNTGKWADMNFYSIKQAKFFNPDFEDFTTIETDGAEKMKNKQQKFFEILNQYYKEIKEDETYYPYSSIKKTLEEYESKEVITINKNKLVLLSKLLKDIKNLSKEKNEKEAKKYTIQRRIIESLFSEEALNKHITTLTKKIKKLL